MWGLLAWSYRLGRVRESLEGTLAPVQGEGPTKAAQRERSALPCPAQPAGVIGREIGCWVWPQQGHWATTRMPWRGGDGAGACGDEGV